MADDHHHYQEPIEADSTEDEGIAEASSTSLLSSIESEIRRGKEENGRIYATYGSHEYGLPVDDEELDRLDMNHQKYTMLMGDNLFLAPIDPNPQRIIDLGTGTGIWAIDMADKYPSASVIGTDIAPVQPQWTPPNCQFQIDDVESDWTFGENTFDFIHARDFYHSIRDWKKLVRQAYDHLKPGGWMELQSVWPVPGSDDNTLPLDSGFMELCMAFQEIGARMATEPDAPKLFATWLREEGFTNINQHVFKIPSSPWPRDPRLKKVGAFELLNVVEGARAFLLRGFTREFGKTIAEMEMLIMRCRKELCLNKFHCYVPFYVVYGQKPYSKESTAEEATITSPTASTSAAPPASGAASASTAP